MLKPSTPLNLPPINWSKVLIFCVAGVGTLMILGLLLKIKTLFILGDILLAGLITILIVVGVVALIAKLNTPSK